jgi:hypothetical protein
MHLRIVHPLGRAGKLLDTKHARRPPARVLQHPVVWMWRQQRFVARLPRWLHIRTGAALQRRAPVLAAAGGGRAPETLTFWRRWVIGGGDGGAGVRSGRGGSCGLCAKERAPSTSWSPPEAGTQRGCGCRRPCPSPVRSLCAHPPVPLHSKSDRQPWPDQRGKRSYTYTSCRCPGWPSTCRLESPSRPDRLPTSKKLDVEADIDTTRTAAFRRYYDAQRTRLALLPPPKDM